jgi:glutamyl-tRNA synthetase
MRVRFAPSPTGALHIGGARTALFNWLLARHNGGAFVLRIEDTDRERSTPENVEQILDALRWLELDWDEGPILQSERAPRHREVLQALLQSGHAYRSNATSADVAAYKQLHGAERGFRGEGGAGDRKEGAVRLHVPAGGETVVHDVIRGDTSFEHVHLDDPVIARADGSVLYNFAVAIDDLDAQITHVVRGEDHLSNTPKQLLVLKAAKAVGFGADAPEPLYAHLPLLHGPDGKKLSKRHGAASVQELRDAGYIPEAVRDYIAQLGWGADPDQQKLMSTSDLIAAFTLERVSRNPARFDEVKLRWLNGVHIRTMTVDRLVEYVREFLRETNPPAAALVEEEPQKLRDAVEISQEKIHTLADFWPLAGFLFEQRAIDPKARSKWLEGDGLNTLRQVHDALVAVDSESFGQTQVQAALESLVQQLGVKPGQVYQPLRVAIAGCTVSPGIFESVLLLGREEALGRIDAVLVG